MFRKLFCSLLAFGMCAGGLLAEVVQGKVKSADAGNSTIVVTAGGKDQTFKVSGDVRVFTIEGNKAKILREGLKAVTAGADVKLTHGDDKVVTQIQVGAGEIKKKEDK